MAGGSLNPGKLSEEFAAQLMVTMGDVSQMETIGQVEIASADYVDDQPSYLVIVKDDIAHDAVGTVQFAEGAPGSEIPFTPVDELDTVANSFLPMVWAGSKVEISWCSWHGTEPGWQITAAYSATRVLGTAVGDVAETESTFAITDVQGIDGQYKSADIASVVNSHGWKIDADGLVRAEWNDEAGQWEAYQVTCPVPLDWTETFFDVTDYSLGTGSGQGPWT